MEKQIPFITQGIFGMNVPGYFLNTYLYYNDDLFPSTIYIDGMIDIQKVIQAMKQFPEFQLKRSHTYFNKGKLNSCKSVFYITPDKQCSIFIETISSTDRKKTYTNGIHFIFNTKEQKTVNPVFEALSKIKPHVDKFKNKINIVIQDGTEFKIKDFDIKKPQLNLQYNYNDDLIEIHKLFVSSLNQKNNKGLALLYGDPGCGKTNYIKFLMSVLKKKVIYLPPNLANEISSPGFVNFLTEHPNSILVIEDAENILKSRKGGSNQAISNILNISDGLLSDILNIQIIATFNCKLDEIDPALLRKGRLIAKYNFTKLTKNKSQLLSNKLKFKNTITQEMSLSEIYNQDDKSFTVQEYQPIGFIRQAV